jgi:hypothetical protein
VTPWLETSPDHPLPSIRSSARAIAAGIQHPEVWAGRALEQIAAMVARLRNCGDAPEERFRYHRLQAFTSAERLYTTLLPAARPMTTDLG